MKVLQINCVYNTGSTGKIMQDIDHRLQAQGIETVICYGRGKNVSVPGGYKTCGELYSKWNNLRSRMTGIMYGGCGFSTRKLIRIIQSENPDVVHLHCINGYFVNVYRLVEWLKENKIATVLTLHAEFMYTANCGYALDCERWKTGCGHCPRRKQETKSILLDRTASSWKRMRQAFAGFGDRLVVCSVSPWLMERAAASPILKEFRHEVVMNGLNTSVFKHTDASSLRGKYHLEGKKVVLHVTPNFTSPIKGGRYVLELAQRMQREDVAFVVVGNTDRSLSMPENVLDVGRVEDQSELAAFYSLADVTLLTSEKETFSMVCAESLCCGTPVVGFQAGAPEGISLPDYSSFVKYGDTEELQRQLRSFLWERQWDGQEISGQAAHQYSREMMADHYQNIYMDLMENAKNGNETNQG